MRLLLDTHALLWALSAPQHHGDLLDRMLVAQAMCESMTLVSRDRELAKYGVKLLWRNGVRARPRNA